MTRLQEYFEDQKKIFNEHHSRLLIDVTEDDIHKIRTTLKRLKNFNILLDGLLFRDKDFPSGFTNLFKLSGEIRDIQIQQKILTEYRDPYQLYLSEMLEQKLYCFNIKDSFQEEFQYINDKLDRIEEYHIDEQILANVRTRIDIGLSDIRNISITTTNLHEIRIRLKRVYYTLLMLDENENIENINNIQETIGLWHDHDVTIERLKEFIEYNKEIIELLTKKRDNFYIESLELLKNL
jgi:CHAD domain-containing protein